MKEVIAIVNHKGGVAKTTTCQAVGTGLSRKGYKVLFVDLDAQANLTFCLGVNQPELTALELLTGQATAKEVIHSIDEHQALIPASPSLAGADTFIIGTGKEYRLKEALSPITKDFDYILIDTPPALSTLTVNALTACDSVIIPALAEAFSIQGIGLLNDTIQAVQAYTNPGLTIKGILLTNNSSNTILSKDMKANLQQTADYLGTKLFDTWIRHTVAVGEAQASQQSLYDYAPKATATEDYTALIEEILKK